MPTTVCSGLDLVIVVAVMFTLAVIHDTIKVAASQLSSDIVASLTHNINVKYANRILPNVGLCVAHFDYLDISEGHIRNGDGCTYFKIGFRLIVYRPFIGEVLVGKVKSSDEQGMRITMGFFDDIHVSWEGMPQPSAYDRTEAAWFWVWVNDDLDGTGSGGDVDKDLAAVYEDPFQSRKEERFYFIKDEPVRFIVDGDEFNEPEPPGPSTWKDSAIRAPGQSSDQMEIESAKRVAPYKIRVGRCVTVTSLPGQMLTVFSLFYIRHPCRFRARGWCLGGAMHRQWKSRQRWATAALAITNISSVHRITQSHRTRSQRMLLSTTMCDPPL